MANQATYAPVATDAANQYGIPAGLFQWQIGQESSWNPNASNGQAQGIAQFMPATAAQYGVDVNDPVSSIYGAANYDADLFAQYGNWGAVLNHYGTVSANSPQSVIDGANAQLSSLGAQTLPGSTPAASGSSQGGSSPAASSGVLGTVLGALKTGAGAAVNAVTGGGGENEDESLWDLGPGRIGYMAVGLVLIAGALYLLKPVQAITNTTLGGGAVAGLRHAGKTVAGALTLG